MHIRSHLPLLTLSLAAASANAQVLQIIDQTRFIEGTTTSTMEDGSVNTQGPFRMEAPPGMFLPMPLNVDAPGNMMVHGMQEGGWDGGDFIRLNQFQMTFSGGGGPNTAGTGTLTNTFGYTFLITQPADYILDVSFGGSPPINVRFQLDGPGIHIDDNSVDAVGTGNLVEYRGRAGTFVPGTYTLLLQGTGTISYTGPGGNGGGAGGNPPVLSLMVHPAAPPQCGTADFDGDGDTGTDADIEAFFACLGGNCCATCFPGGADFDADGDTGTDADIESFFRVLAGGPC